jgi:deazaflavin-dependent oxidoreductase (nitroreductase family)
MAPDEYCYLTTTGRRSGNQHEIEMWFARDGDTFYLLAGGGRSSDWVRNIESNHRVAVRLGDDRQDAVGRILDASNDADEAERARSLVFDKYQPRYDGDLLEWRERSLPVALDIVDRGIVAG